jgi:hypothetical protein
MIPTVGSVVLAALWGLISGICSMELALRHFPNAPAAVRYSVCGLIWHAFLLVLFFGLAGIGCFTVAGATVSWFVVLWLVTGCNSPGGFGARVSACFERVAAAVKRDWFGLITQWREASDPLLRPAIALCGGWLLMTAVRGLFMPPVSHDAWTYHLFLAANWVKKGGFFHLPAPDVWGFFYHFCPANAEVLYAWFMLPFHGDLVVNLGAYPAWLTMVVTFYALARHLGGSPVMAAWGTLFLAFNPVVFVYLNSAYVEVPLLAALLGGVLFLLEARRDHRIAPLFMAAIAFGIALGIKLIAAPLVVIALMVLSWQAWQQGGTLPKKCRLISAILVLTVLFGGVWYARNLWLTGNPVFPLGLRLPGIVDIPVNQAWVDHVNGFLGQFPERETAYWKHERKFWLEFLDPLTTHGFGLLLPWCLVLTPWGVISLIRRGHGALVGVSAMWLLVLLTQYFSPGNICFRWKWTISSSRWLSFPMSLLLLGALPVWGREGLGGAILRLPAQISLLVALFLTGPFAWDTGWSSANNNLEKLVPVGGVLIWCGLWWGPALNRRALALFLVAGLGGVAMLPGFKEKYRAKALGRSFEIHPIKGNPGEGFFEVVESLKSAHRIAFCAGWDRTGHNWHWYPLLGARLQHEVVYVPITSNGEIVHYYQTERLTLAADYAAWRERLRQEHVDLLVCLPPFSQEWQWARQNPDQFLPQEIGTAPRLFAVKDSAGNTGVAVDK